MSARVFVVSDLHLHHAGQDRRRAAMGGPSDAAEHFEDQWRSMITKRDVVWILGDVGMHRRAYETLATWPGMKRLVMGNHDDSRWFGDTFLSVHTCLEHDGVLFTHYPVERSSVRPRYRANVHGHTHGIEFAAVGGGTFATGRPVHFNISPEAVEYRIFERGDLVEQVKYLAPPWERQQRDEALYPATSSAAAGPRKGPSSGAVSVDPAAFGAKVDRLVESLERIGIDAGQAELVGGFARRMFRSAGGTLPDLDPPVGTPVDADFPGVKYPHRYPSLYGGKCHGTSNCAHDCGAWMGPSRSGGPDPFGECPKHPDRGEP